MMMTGPFLIMNAAAAVNWKVFGWSSTKLKVMH